MLSANVWVLIHSNCTIQTKVPQRSKVMGILSPTLNINESGPTTVYLNIAPFVEVPVTLQVNSTGEYFLGNNTIPAQLGAMTHEYQITGK